MAVNLVTTAVSGGDAEGDVLVDVENIEGSRYGDVLPGDSGVNRLLGAGGDDTLVGGAGADWLNGDLGADTVSYAGSVAAVTVNLATDAVSGGDAEGDVLVGIENLEGSAYWDTLAGDNGANRLYGGAGHDWFIFRQNDGNDYIWDFTKGKDLIDLSAFGLPGFDALSISSAPNSVRTDLTAHGGGTISVFNSSDSADIDLDTTNFVF